MPRMIKLIRTGLPGRPRKRADPKFLARSLSTQSLLSISHLARVMGISRSSVYRYMKTFKISHDYSSITSAQLDVMLRAYRYRQPGSGRSYVMAFLRRHCLRVQRHRVIDAMHRTDGSGTTVRRRRTIIRRVYRVSRPNYLWHMDGHHKLIKFGFVIHGIIDGYCRTVKLDLRNFTLLRITQFGCRLSACGLAQTIGHRLSSASSKML
jgi:hypothetical protein